MFREVAKLMKLETTNIGQVPGKPFRQWPVHRVPVTHSIAFIIAPDDIDDEPAILPQNPVNFADYLLQVERVIEAIDVDSVQGAILIIQRMKIPWNDIRIVLARIQVDSDRVATKLAQCPDFLAAPGTEAQDLCTVAQSRDQLKAAAEHSRSLVRIDERFAAKIVEFRLLMRHVFVIGALLALRYRAFVLPCLGLERRLLHLLARVIGRNPFRTFPLVSETKKIAPSFR